MKALYRQVKDAFIQEPQFASLFNRKIMLQVLCWSLFIVYEIGSIRYMLGKIEPLYVYAVFYTLNIGYFYTCTTILNYTFRRERAQYWRGLILWVLSLMVYISLKRFADILFYTPADPRVAISRLRTVIPVYLIRTLSYTFLAVFYWAAGYIAYFKRQAAESERRELVTARDKAEINNAYLQQQINPHLLFNTLNFIYGEVYKGSPEAGRSVLLLSDIIRFGLEAAGPDGKTALADELLHTSQLLEITRYRFHHDLCLDLDIDGEPGTLRIIPLVLLTLTENVFKHGNLKNTEDRARIRIAIGPSGRLLYHSRNAKKAKSAFQRSGGLGLQNLRLRLDFAYPGRYELNIMESEHHYELTLTINL